MLVDEPKVLVSNPIFDIIGRGVKAIRLEQGCHQISHFGSTSFLDEYEHYPEVSVGPYGVCDSLEQLKAKCPELSDPARKFVVTLTEVRKDKQPEEGGWRWHKWGEYIGEHQIEREYLADEEGIERVFCFQIYEKVN